VADGLMSIWPQLAIEIFFGSRIPWRTVVPVWRNGERSCFSSLRNRPHNVRHPTGRGCLSK